MHSKLVYFMYLIIPKIKWTFKLKQSILFINLVG